MAPVARKLAIQLNTIHGFCEALEWVAGEVG